MTAFRLPLLRKIRAGTAAAVFLSAALALAPGLAGVAGVAGAQSRLAVDAAPTLLSSDLDGGRALWANPALMVAEADSRWDTQLLWEKTTLRRWLFDLSGQGLHLGYRYDSQPRVPLSELRLAGAWGSPAVGIGYVFRTQHESVFGPRAGGAVDVGFFLRPSGHVSFSWVGRNVGNSSRLDSRNQLIALSLRPVGPAVTVGGELRWDEGGYRTNSYRLGARAVVIPSLELSATYQPPRLSVPREVRVGLTVRAPHTDLEASSRPGVEGMSAEHSLGISLRAAALPRASSMFGLRRTVSVQVAGPLGEEGSGFSLLGGRRNSLRQALKLLRQAAEDPSVRGVLLVIGPMDRGLLGPLTAQGDELRQGVLDVRRAGKPVVGYLDAELVGPAEMYLASACDRVMAPRLANVVGLGVAVEVRRLRGTFAKLGIRWEHAEEGKYKSTFHSYYTDSSNAAQREELTSLVHEAYTQLVRSLVEGRALPEDSARALCDGRGLTAVEARDKGLLDMLGWSEDAQAELNRLCGREPASSVRPLVLEPAVETRWGIVPGVAVVTAEGEIIHGRDDHSLVFGGSTVGSKSLSERLERAAREPGVRAVVLRVNSGGGSALASDRIRDTLEKIRRERRLPLVVSMGEMAASGGYLISALADEIYADSMTVTGSIGVVWSLPTFAGLYEKLDARREVFKEGEHSDLIFAGRPFSPEERRELRHLVDDGYQDFLGIVARGRKMPMAAVQAAAQGRIWWGMDGARLGLVDHLGGLYQAVDGAARRAGLSPGYRIVEVEKPRGGLLARLVGGPLYESMGEALERGAN